MSVGSRGSAPSGEDALSHSSDAQSQIASVSNEYIKSPLYKTQLCR